MLHKLLAAMMTCSVLACTATHAYGAGALLTLDTTQNTQAIQAYEVLELTFRQPGAAYAGPFHDVTIDVTFTSATGKTFTVGGFHYGSLQKPQIIRRTAPGQRRAQIEYKFAAADTWKARFAPAETGRWTWAFIFRNNSGQEAKGAGQFLCVKGRHPNAGFVRQDPNSPFRWVFDDGGPYFPIGLQEGYGDGQGLGTFLANMAMEGPFRLDRPASWPAPPPGAAFQPGPSMNPQNADVHYRRYSRCGFNLFRFSQANNTPLLNDNLERYLVQEAIMTDELMQHARKYRMRIMYGIFGFQNAFNDHPDNAAGMEKVKRFIKYSVDRWGAYIDFWELLNEQNANDRWYEITVPYLKSIDPYHHPVATSWERPQLAEIDVSAPHWYTGINNLNCDQDTASLATQWKKFQKPVIVGEHGNTSPSKPAEKRPGIGGVWDINSATRMRIRNWTALFSQISFVFWNTSYAKDGHYMNIWLGPKERQYVRAMQDFAYCMGGGLEPARLTLTPHDGVRGFAMASKNRAGVYLHHFRDHETPVRNLSITLDVPRAAKGYWYSTETAAILKTIDCPAGTQTFAVPEFIIDLALLITPDGPPDIDKDGKPNDVDDDNDNDGVPNAKDAFPLEPEEWADRDGDGIGDNLDADKDADGVGDDDNHNGIADFLEMDFDGDGVPRASAVPWDAFPLDPKEWRDTDGDGVGDNADDDDDGDGFTDQEELKAGTDPLNKLSFPVTK